MTGLHLDTEPVSELFDGVAVAVAVRRIEAVPDDVTGAADAIVAIDAADAADAFDPMVEATMSPARRREFRCGRRTARAALRAAGLADRPIPRGPRGQPCWPAGAVGSITHAAGWCAAVVAPTSSAVAIGLDITPDEAVTERAVRDRILAPPERDHTAALDADRATVTFAAKEAVFKAVFPRWGVWLEHHDVWLALEPGRFTVVRGLETIGHRVDGRWARSGGFVLAGCAIGPAR